MLKVLFEIGQRQVAEQVKAGTLQRELRVLVSKATHPATCPFDPERIRQPENAVVEVDEQRRMGF